MDLAAAKALEEKGVRADYAAGFSLGEVAAAAFAGIFTDKSGFEGGALHKGRVESAAYR